MYSPKDLLDSFVKDNLLDQATADKYIVDSLQRDVPIETYLINEAKIDAKKIYQTKAKLLNVGYVDLSGVANDPQATSLIPENLARNHNILPYSYNAGTETLFIATDDPLNLSLADFLQQKSGKRIILNLADPSQISRFIGQFYAQSLSPEVSRATTEVKSQEKQQLTSTEESEQDAPIAKIVNTIVDFAIRARASDIHIEPQENKVRVRYRIDGVLEEKLSLPKAISESLISRIKILSQMKIDEKRIPQDGRFNFKTDSEEFDLRVSTLPTTNGEKVVMRLLRKSGGMPSLADLGLRGTQFKALEVAISRPYGLILVTGPTGSGKTTSLYSILNKLNKPGVNILTLEDPVEYQLPGINQVQINPMAGLTFSVGLRAFLRQDPNIILVGEIRDGETSQLAIQAALTGHLVFSTLHTNDAATAIPRLIDLGGEPFLVASVLNASVAQRIARRVCEDCREWYDPDREVIDDIKRVLGNHLPSDYQNGRPIQLARGKGCQKCRNSGYSGRIAIFEILSNTREITRLILQRASAKSLTDKAIEEGMILMKQDGYLKALDGLTTIEEVLRVAEV